MKSKLLSLPDNQLFYLPLLKLNTSANTAVQSHSAGNFVVLVDQNTSDNKPLGRPSIHRNPDLIEMHELDAPK